MSNIALIPCRGGSKGIPRKNLQLVHGVPLVIRAVYTCLHAGIDEVFVSTDDETIAAFAIVAGAKVLNRPSVLSQDKSSTDEVLAHAIQSLFDLGYNRDDRLFLLQATSPFTQSSTLREGIRILEENPDSGIFTTQEWHGFIWNLKDQIATPEHHDHRRRSRRQDLSPRVLETGGIYGARINSFLTSKIRFVDPLIAMRVDRKEGIEIDSIEDLDFCNNIRDRSSKSPQDKVKIIFSDYDGVFTDNRVLQTEDGEYGTSINRSDGVAINKFKSHGIPLVIITGEKSGSAFSRSEKLKIECIYSEDKLLEIINYCNIRSIRLSEVAYVGNDINDLGPLATCGWSFTPKDAHRDVAIYSRHLLQAKGGEGVIRELSEILLPQSP
jgi:YrbI family 3-deoxy-D-manno-octulosonate 8-phosphate phosphatase